MNDGFTISGGGTRIVEKIVTVEKIVEVAVQASSQNGFHTQSENEEEIMNKELYKLLKVTLDSSL